MSKRWTFLALTMCLLWMSGAPALAHQPRVLEADKLFVVDDPLLSAALYGTFEHGDEFFEVKLEPATPLALPIEVLVPRRDAYEDHRPLFAIIGLGLPAATEAEEALLPQALPAGTGVLVGRYAREDREVIFESFTRRIFWTNGATAYVLPAGDVRIWIWSPEGTTGDFVLGFGVEEGGQDAGEIFSNWSDYAY
jgi:hypothetical protein